MDSKNITVARRDTIGDAFRRAAMKHRDQPALHFEDRVWSYRNLYAAAGRVASWLAEKGLKPGDRILALGKNSDAYYILWLACCRGGFVHVPANYALKPNEIAYVYTHSSCSGLFVDPSMLATVTASGVLQTISLWGTFTGDGADTILSIAGDERQSSDYFCESLSHKSLAQLLYTSGTTSAPKAAMMTHGGLLTEYMACMADCDYSFKDRALAAMPLYHSAQMHAFSTPQILTGAPTFLLAAPDPKAIFKTIEKQRINSFFAPPTVWINLLRQPEFDHHDLSSLQKIYYGAAIMPEPVLLELAKRLPRAGLYNCYGQSEIAPVATVLRPHEHKRRPTSAGRPIMTVETRIVDENMQDVPAGERGEIVHRSAQLLVGYWGQDEETEKAFEGGWFHSGDVGYFDDQGYLYIVDRVKDVINTGGVLVASREVEDVLLRHPQVSEAAVIALPDPKWIEIVAAVIVPRTGQTIVEDDLVAHARKTLADFKAPKRIFITDELPKNTAGKVLKKDLRSRYSQLIHSEQ